MNIFVKEALERVLKEKLWNVGVDLGCGYGDGASTLKRYTNHLYGVDISWVGLCIAETKHCYDLLIKGDLFQFPEDMVDVAFLMDVIEHLPKPIGMKLLSKLHSTVVLSTPVYWNKGCFAFWWSPHQSLWSEQELEECGFATEVVRTNKMKLDTIIGIRE